MKLIISISADSDPDCIIKHRTASADRAPPSISIPAKLYAFCYHNWQFLQLIRARSLT
jgi:hypothetical protein